MDKKWTSLPRHIENYQHGVNSFLDFVFRTFLKSPLPSSQSLALCTYQRRRETVPPTTSQPPSQVCNLIEIAVVHYFISNCFNCFCLMSVEAYAICCSQALLEAFYTSQFPPATSTKDFFPVPSEH
ncbi:uncharacterized protein LOC110263857 [Arachis ipaensis]|uniref:uncharacterized protein LOC110263857 n=1 Tax=Arachis ipaensis TaxID=130454 RepID=UPI000A2B5719|nr:uncharacterized protein LOC110263857 [Arachis ipaensis]